MKRIVPAPLPRKRNQHLVIDELADEVLVYDLERHRAHCLNHTAALIWQHCDGQSTAAQIAQRLTRELQTPFTEDLVWLALDQLEKLHLLEQSKSLPPQSLRLSRRRMIRSLGLAAAVTLPVVTSIMSPTPAQASTCAGSGQSCASMACCPGRVCSGGTCTP